MELPDKEEEAAGAQPDPFARLEKGVEDRRRGREGAERIAELRDDSAAKYKDDYTINKALRRQLRYVFPAMNVPHSKSRLCTREHIWSSYRLPANRFIVG